MINHRRSFDIGSIAKLSSAYIVQFYKESKEKEITKKGSFIYVATTKDAFQVIVSVQ